MDLGALQIAISIEKLPKYLGEIVPNYPTNLGEPSTWVKSYPTTQVLGSNHTQLHVVGCRSRPNPTFSLRTLDMSQDGVSKQRGGSVSKGGVS